MFIDKLLFSKIKNTNLIDIFRFFWGLIMAAYFTRLIYYTNADYYYFNTIFHFRYPFFEWIPIFEDQIIKFIIVIGIISSLLFSLGAFYKRSSLIMFISYCYLFLIDVSYWNNHYYLFALVNFFFIITNMYSSLSIDGKYRAKKTTIYSWEILLFKLQIALVYFYGAVSKLSNPEWLNFKSVDSIYSLSFLEKGISLNPSTFHLVVIFITFSGIIFDLLVPFLLFSRNKTIKTLGFISIIIFHLTNAYLLKIGLFPYAMIFALVIFINMNYEFDPNELPKKKSIFWIKPFLLTFAIIQLTLPLRHFLIKGNVFWTGEAKLFSWHMMSGHSSVLCTNFKLIEKNEIGEIREIHNLNIDNFLNLKQKRVLGTHPFLAPQFFKFLKKEANLAGMTNVEINGSILVNRNNKNYRYIISPKIDLSSLKYSYFKHNEWILLYKDEYY